MRARSTARMGGATAAIFAVVVPAVLVVAGCRAKRDVPFGAACSGPYVRSDHACVAGATCVLVAGKGYVCTRACTTSAECASLGPHWTCSPPLVHEGIGGCTP